MECVIPSRYIKLFAKSIQCMGKVGEELHIKANSQKVLMTAFNASRSAFLAFYLDDRFFDTYLLENNTERKIQVKLKACLAVFRQYTNVEKCTIRLDEYEQRLVFELLCKHGVKKVYKLTFEDVDPVLALYNKEEQSNRIVSVPKKMLDCINNFQGQLDEITLIASKDSLRVKTHIEDLKSAQKVLQTELSIDSGDFEEYDIRNETHITICLKEFKTILNFCDASGQPVTMLFERGGAPFLLSVKYFGVFESDFVLATLVDNSTQVSSGTTSTTSSQSINSSTSTPESALLRKRKDRNEAIDTPTPSLSAPPKKQIVSKSPNFISKADFTASYSPSSSNEVIHSSSGKSHDPVKQPSQIPKKPLYANVGPQNDESFVDGDYEPLPDPMAVDETGKNGAGEDSEVDGTPPPPKIQKYNAEQAMRQLQDEDETEERMEEEEEVPCSVEE